VISAFLTLQFILILFTSIPKPKTFFLTSMKSFNVISTAAAMRGIPSVKESPVKVASCTLVASSDLDKVLDVTKDITRGADAPMTKMGGQLANIDGRPAMSFGRPSPLEVGHSTHAREASPCAQGRGP
jgi:hypothetical protein